MEALLRESIAMGGDFCGRVVDLAAEIANTIVLALLETAWHIGVESVTFMDLGFLLAADTACTASYQGIQQLLDNELSSQDSSSTIDLPAASAGATSGTFFQFLIVCNGILSGFLLYSPWGKLHIQCCEDTELRAGNLMTISQKLRLRTSARLLRSSRLLQQEFPAGDDEQIPRNNTTQVHVTALSTNTVDQPANRHASTRTLQPVTMHGRRLASLQTAQMSHVERVAPKRYLTPSNQLVGGVFLHHQRKKEVVTCSQYFSQKLAHACEHWRATYKVIRGSFCCCVANV
jgi:hypothetical protein